MIKESFIELIDKYLSGMASGDEQQLVDEYLMRLETNGTSPLDTNQEQKVKEAMWREIQQKTTKQTAEVVQMHWHWRKSILPIAVAASIMLVVGLGLFFLSNTKQDEQSIAIENKKQTDSTLFVVHREINTTGKDKSIQLSDGSLVVLKNRSEITYRLPFTDGRLFSLVGKGYFKVAKEPTKPFTVTTGEISTTALGTEFTITAFKNTDQIIVQLYEGKVVVKAVDSKNKRMKKDVYLLPGEELVYGGSSVKVRTFRSNGHTSSEQKFDELSGDDPTIPGNNSASYFMFNNQSLAQVLDNLAALNNVKIMYDKKYVQNIYFTGKYNRSDSLEPILRRIGTLNNLTITKKDNAFIISR